MEQIASYILAEKELVGKIEVVYYLSKRVDIFFDTTVIFKAEIAKMFMNEMNIKDIDTNLVLTAVLLYGCKKKDVPQNLDEIRAYPRESAEFLKSLGFSERFCKICRQHSRHEDLGPREKESDILELVDQFGGMMMNRPERMGFKADEALCLLEYRNLKGKDNAYLELFKEFVERMEKVKV